MIESDSVEAEQHFVEADLGFVETKLEPREADANEGFLEEWPVEVEFEEPQPEVSSEEIDKLRVEAAAFRLLTQNEEAKRGYLEQAESRLAAEPPPRLVSTSEQRDSVLQYWSLLCRQLERYHTQLKQLRHGSGDDLFDPELLDAIVEPRGRPLGDALASIDAELAVALDGLSSLWEAWDLCEPTDLRLVVELDSLGLTSTQVDVSVLAEERDAMFWKSLLARFFFEAILSGTPSLFPFHQLVCECFEEEHPGLTGPGWRPFVNALETSMSRVRTTLDNLGVAPLELPIYVDFAELQEQYESLHFTPLPLAGSPLEGQLSTMALPAGTVVRYESWAFRNSNDLSWLNSRISVWICDR